MSGDAPRIEVRLPSVLKVAVGKDRIRVRARTVPDALDAAYAELPQLRYHLTLDSGGLRPHILCLVNGESVQREDLAGFELADGDELLIHQAISGG
ncbi:MAG: MoaD/ThiS family protein [Planctomycetota bacterium]|jgi:sulfur carrier protein ThiS